MFEGRAAKRKRQNNQVTQADFYVDSLPSLPSNIRTSIYAGHLPSAAHSEPSRASDAHLFFLLAKHKHIPKKERLLIFLNGGPGCSSLDGAFIENVGPIRIAADGTVSIVEGYSWGEYANVLFLDQPAGTGFSYVSAEQDDVRELAEAADQVVVFLANLYKVFPEYANMDTYLGGESYAGQTIPYIAAAISKTTLVSTPLKGLIIGNAWISPKDQYLATLDHIIDKGILKKGSKGAKLIDAANKKCEKEIIKLEKESGGSGKGMVLIPECEEIWFPVIEATKNKEGQCLNLYDVSKYEECGAVWPPDITQVTKYLHRPDVVKALHAEKSAAGWSHCSATVGSHFLTLESIPSISLFPKLLETIPILLYVGEHDLVCPSTGIERAISKLEWNGAIGFNGTESLDWTVDSQLAGSWTTARGLTYVHVLNASHMVPMDQPLAAHDMLIRFMQVDTLNAAGVSALIPSRIGVAELEVILGATKPDGSALDSTLKEVADAAVIEKEISEDGFDKDHELMYGPRRTFLLFLFLLLGVFCFWMFCQWKRSKRRSRFRGRKGKGKSKGKKRGAAVQLDSTQYQASYTEDSNPFQDDSLKDNNFEGENVFDLGEEEEGEEEEEDEKQNLFEAGDLEGDIGRS